MAKSSGRDHSGAKIVSSNAPIRHDKIHEQAHYMGNLLRRVEGVESPTLRQIAEAKRLIGAYQGLGRKVARFVKRAEKG